MANRTILILGGYGLAGKLIAEYMLRETDVNVVLAGRTWEHATDTRDEFNASFKGKRVTAARVDAANSDELEYALTDVDLVIVASSTAQYATVVANAAIKTKTDYIDIQYSTARLKALQNMEDEIRAAGRVFITEGGFHPGVPGAMVRYAAGKVEGLTVANVSCALRVDWKSYAMGEDTVKEFTGELLDYDMSVFKNGAWHKASMLSKKDMMRKDFGPPFGKLMAAPMLLEEMRMLPEMLPKLKETGFYITGFNWISDMIIMPLAIVMLKIAPQRLLKAASRLLFWSMSFMSRSPYGIVLELDGESPQQTVKIKLKHEDGYVLTAIPTVACVKQYLDGKIDKGLQLMAHAVDAEQYFDDIVRMGITVGIKVENRS